MPPSQKNSLRSWVIYSTRGRKEWINSQEARSIMLIEMIACKLKTEQKILFGLTSIVQLYSVVVVVVFS